MTATALQQHDHARPARLEGPPQPVPRVRTVVEALARAARSTSGLTLLDATEQETPVPYASLYDGARRVAGSLAARGVRAGDRVLLVLPTSRDFLEALFGVQLLGATPVPVYPPARLGRLGEYVKATAAMASAVGAALVLTDRRTQLLLGEVVALARPRLGCSVVGELPDASPCEAPVASQTLGLIQFSSGSTVAPKPVALSHRNLVAQLASLEEALGADRHGAAVSWLPLYHDMGLIGVLFSALYQQRPLVLMGPEVFLARPALWLRALSRHRATISPAPNFGYGLCLKRVKDEDVAGIDLSSWSVALNGAEPVSADVMDRFSARFGRYGFRREALRPVYGLAESSLAVTFTAPRGEKRRVSVDSAALAVRGELEPGSRTVVSVGAAVPGAEVEVRDDAGEVLPEGRVGRIFTRSASVMTGYFGQPDATARALTGEGWLDTGDLGFVDGGELFVTGRAKDVIIIRGGNHTPQDFEECVAQVPGVRLGCVVALGFVPQGSDDEQLLVLVEQEVASGPDLAARITAQVLTATGIKPHTVAVLARGALPRTSSGKLRRREALAQYLAGTLRAPAPSSALRLGGHVLKSVLGHVRAQLGAGHREEPER